MSLYGKLPPPPSNVAVEYDQRGKRVTKQFTNAYEARRFYVRMLKANRNPLVKKGS